tara:strand:+ start:68 stop:652 length:585 start_codon:yes stop_codon:yes gene_type:complete
MSTNSICWNCQNIIPPNIFLCQKCNKIQPPKQVNEFRLLGISEKFDLDLEELEDAYLKLQQIYHPDKYSQLSEKEIKYSTLLSSMINEAYQKLSSSISRASVLLQLNGINSHSEDSSFNDSQVLEEIMEIQNEFLEAEDTEQKKISIQKLNSRITKTINDLSRSFKKKEYEIAKKLNIKLSYLEKIRVNFKKQL